MKAPRASAISSSHGDHDGADSVKRFAAKHGISRAQAYVEINAGRLTARKVGSGTIITREDAAKWRRALSKLAVKDEPNAREPDNGLPAWLVNPKQPARPSRRRGRATKPETTEPK
jgi:hypothetical protein